MQSNDGNDGGGGGGDNKQINNSLEVSLKHKISHFEMRK